MTATRAQFARREGEAEALRAEVERLRGLLEAELRYRYMDNGDKAGDQWCYPCGRMVTSLSDHDESCPVREALGAPR